MKLTTIIMLALPALALAKPISDADWLSQHEGHHEEHGHHKHYEGPTPTYNPYPLQSVSYGGWKRSEKVKKDTLPEPGYYEPPKVYGPPAYPTQSVTYSPYKRFAKRHAIAQPEPIAASQPGVQIEADEASEVLTA